jgi:endonuclease/exonuclease/phosphatase family metal-dependent hydrolase
MLTFAYWNLNRKPLEAEIGTLVHSHQVDVLILSEFAGSPVSMQQRLNAESTPQYHYAAGRCEHVQIFTRFSPDFLRATYEGQRISIRRLTLPARLEILVVAAHFPSKFNWSEDSQAFECIELARIIKEQEAHVGHARTLVVGDLNMNPFEKGLVSANGLNAVMSRQVASRGTRVVQSKEYPFFFNPMWAHLGDRPGRPPGSYFYDGSEHVNYYWNVFDQVIIRPELMDHCDAEGIRILTQIGESSLLLDDGRPDDRKFSDHLPLLFGIEL